MIRRKPTPKQIRDSARRAAFRKGFNAGLKHVYRFDGPMRELLYRESTLFRMIPKGGLTP